MSLDLFGDMCSIKGSKENNEDYALLSIPFGACVADGMGGEQMGKTIARCACKAAMRAISEGDSAYDSLVRAQSFSRELVYNLDYGGGGAALTVIRCDNSDVEVAWAGDVLCMLLKGSDGSLEVLTIPDRGTRGLTNALGRNHITINSVKHRLDPGDRLLLCSDGLWEHSSHEQIKEHLLKAETPREAAVMLTMGQEREDDATAVVLFAE